ADITVNGKYGPGDLVPGVGEVRVAVRVFGPSWVSADRVELYANGVKIRESRIGPGQPAGVKWSGEWVLPRFRHDVHLGAGAAGRAGAVLADRAAVPADEPPGGAARDRLYGGGVDRRRRRRQADERPRVRRAAAAAGGG